MTDEPQDQEEQDQPERLSEEELMQEGANLDESVIEGEGPRPK